MKEFEKSFKMGYWVSVFAVMFLVVIPLIANAGEIKIGSLFPYSGSLAFLGTETSNGVELAVEMVNERAESKEIRLS